MLGCTYLRGRARGPCMRGIRRAGDHGSRLPRDGGAEDLRQAFRFLQKYQRADGDYQVSQSAGLIDWFKDYPYAYIHPDSSSGYLIAMGEFYRATGDMAFVRESWPSIQKAYQYLSVHS